MRVSLNVVGLLLFITAFLFLGVYGYSLYTDAVYTESVTTDEGFANAIGDIRLSSCPREMTQFVDDTGSTLCCKSALIGGKCPSGQTACTLSESKGSMPTCSQYFTAVLEEKGKTRCPPSRPNYYEDGLTKGCTAGPRTANGTAPLRATDPKCLLYPIEIEDQSKADSCTNQRLLEGTKCFSRALGETVSLQTFNAELPALITCSYKDPATHMPRTCYSDESLYRFLAALVTKGWAQKDWRSHTGPYEKVQWCSKHQKVYIDKTKKIEDLNSDPIA